MTRIGGTCEMFHSRVQAARCRAKRINFWETHNCRAQSQSIVLRMNSPRKERYQAWQTSAVHILQYLDEAYPLGDSDVIDWDSATMAEIAQNTPPRFQKSHKAFEKLWRILAFDLGHCNKFSCAISQMVASYFVWFRKSWRDVLCDFRHHQGLWCAISEIEAACLGQFRKSRQRVLCDFRNHGRLFCVISEIAQSLTISKIAQITPPRFPKSHETPRRFSKSGITVRHNFRNRIKRSAAISEIAQDTWPWYLKWHETVRHHFRNRVSQSLTISEIAQNIPSRFHRSHERIRHYFPNHETISTDVSNPMTNFITISKIAQN
jgi:hypothetical protein